MPGRIYASATYRYGFNGQEKDDEAYGKGNLMTADFWEYDTRLGRRWNLDPIDMAWESPYACFRNNPIYNIDVNGDCPDGNCDEAKNVFGGTLSIPKGSITSQSSDGQLISFKSDGSEFYFDPSINWYSTLGSGLVYDPSQYEASGNLPRYVQVALKELNIIRADDPGVEWAKNSDSKGNYISFSSTYGSGLNYTMIIYGNSIYENDYPEVGTGESMLPLWGSGKQAVYDFQDGNIGWGLLNSGIAISDIFLLKSLFSGVAKGGFKALGKDLTNWSSWRSFYGKEGFADAGQHLHHWAWARDGAKSGSGFGWWAKNQMWNLKPVPKLQGMTYDMVHKLIEGNTVNGVKWGILKRTFNGTPTWFKALSGAVGGRGANLLRDE